MYMSLRVIVGIFDTTLIPMVDGGLWDKRMLTKIKERTGEFQMRLDWLITCQLVYASWTHAWPRLAVPASARPSLSRRRWARTASRRCTGRRSVRPCQPLKRTDNSCCGCGNWTVCSQPGNICRAGSLVSFYDSKPTVWPRRPDRKFYQRVTATCAALIYLHSFVQHARNITAKPGLLLLVTLKCNKCTISRTFSY